MSEESAQRRLQQDWPELLKMGELKDKEYRLIAPDGRKPDVLLSSRVERDASDRLVRVVEGIVDLTERRAAEKALRQAQKMEAVGQLTGGIAHDFNNLLTVIIGSLERAGKKLSADDGVVRLIDNALEAAHRGASLTQRLLSFARRQNLDPQTVDIPALIEGMRQLLISSLPSNITISTMVSPDTPSVTVDPHQLEMALLNLVVNARDAMRDGGEIAITVSADINPPSALQGGRYVCLKAADKGEGMNPETLAKARDPFFTTKGVGKGTGLGLSMVAGFAEQSGDLLTLESEPGVGTIVELWLPEAMQVAGASCGHLGHHPPSEASDLRGHVVLTVDNDALVLMNTEAMLQDLKAEVIATVSPMEALELSRSRPEISCVVSDYAMPNKTGAQLCQRAGRSDRASPS
jgi:signal transduction histidine kinase